MICVRSNNTLQNDYPAASLLCSSSVHFSFLPWQPTVYLLIFFKKTPCFLQAALYLKSYVYDYCRDSILFMSFSDLNLICLHFYFLYVPQLIELVIEIMITFKFWIYEWVCYKQPYIIAVWALFRPLFVTIHCDWWSHGRNIFSVVRN